MDKTVSLEEGSRESGFPYKLVRTKSGNIETWFLTSLHSPL